MLEIKTRSSYIKDCKEQPREIRDQREILGRNERLCVDLYISCLCI